MTDSQRTRRHIHLRAAGTSLLLSSDEQGRVTVESWGADLGAFDTEAVTAIVDAGRRQCTHSSVDQPRLVELLPQTQAAHAGLPFISGFRPDSGGAPYFSDLELGGDDASATVRAHDPTTRVSVDCAVRLTPEGVVLLDYSVTNDGDDAFAVGSLLASLPVPSRASELLDLSGHWTRERIAQRRPLHQGAWVRESSHGRTGHDATLLLVAGTPAFGFGTGEVWGLHVAWSGNHTTYAEATPVGDRRLGGGELLLPGEVVLGPGETYSAPTVVAAWSDQGLDGLSERLHRYVRSLPHLRGLDRPVVLNTWEAVYFEHDLGRLSELADRAAQVGVERFVLDDGWSAGRTDDQRGLGDWRVDPDRWAEGLHPLVDHVRALGMEFGLWVEPEMVNDDSELARAHPDWVLTAGGRSPLPWRHQQVLDLQHPGAYAHVRDALLSLLAEYPISVLKWDHNRDVFDGLHDGRPPVHGQTLAVYRLIDELRAQHPDLEVESSASGGGRIDLGILARTHRVWTSDTQDALERLGIQRWTSLLVPPEVMGTHVGAPTSHTTGRTLPLAFRATTALLGHFGIEWDLRQASPEDLDVLSEWVALAKEMRPVVGSGRLVRVDHPDPALTVTGVVGEDRRTAYFVFSQVAGAATSTQTPVQLRGLDPATRYRVERVGPRSPEPLVALSDWVLDQGALDVTGRTLEVVGLRPPVLAPHTARVLRLRATT